MIYKALKHRVTGEHLSLIQYINNEPQSVHQLNSSCPFLGYNELKSGKSDDNNYELVTVELREVGEVDENKIRHYIAEKLASLKPQETDYTWIEIADEAVKALKELNIIP